MVVGVDWTAAPAVSALRKKLPGAPKIIHMNFRVFFAQLELLQDSAADEEFYQTMERQACAQADRVIALTSADGNSLAKLFPHPDAHRAEQTETETETDRDRDRESEIATGGLQPAILNPPLRSDIAALAVIAPSASSRRFVTICARISEEKRVLEYVRVVIAARCVSCCKTSRYIPPCASRGAQSLCGVFVRGRVCACACVSVGGWGAGTH